MKEPPKCMSAAQTSRATATQSADTAAKQLGVKHTGAAFIIIITTGLDRSL